MSLYHYLHVYADGPGWPDALTDHIDMIEEAGVVFDQVRVGIVGPPHLRDAVKLCLPEDWRVWVEADEGWEQVTLASIGVMDDDIVCYTHTKGAANDTELNRNWRHHLEYFTLMPWGEALHELASSGADVVCPNWLPVSITGTLPKGCSGFSPGNYWWATGKLIKSLPPVDMTDRYAAETWIGMGSPMVAITDSIPWDPRRWM